MTAVDHAELKRLAEGATPGEWTCKEGSTAYPECDDKDFWAVVLSPAGKEVVTLYERSSFDDRADYDFDAAFIAAANPAVVLGLLSEIEGLKASASVIEPELGDLEASNKDLSRLLSEAERELAVLRTQAPDSWRPDREGDVQKRVEKVVFDHFYGSPLAGSKERLARALIQEFGLSALRPQTAESGE